MHRHPHPPRNPHLHDPTLYARRCESLILRTRALPRGEKGWQRHLLIGPHAPVLKRGPLPLRQGRCFP